MKDFFHARVGEFFPRASLFIFKTRAKTKYKNTTITTRRRRRRRRESKESREEEKSRRDERQTLLSETAGFIILLLFFFLESVRQTFTIERYFTHAFVIRAFFVPVRAAEFLVERWERRSYRDGTSDEDGTFFFFFFFGAAARER